MGGKNLRRFEADLVKLVEDESQQGESRIAAAVVLVERGSRTPKDTVFELLMTACANPETEALSRMTIARILGNAKLSQKQLQQLTVLIAVSGPLELPLLLRAYEEAPEPFAGKELCKALLESPGTSNLSAWRLGKLFERYPEGVRTLAAPLLEKLSSESGDQAARLNELEHTLTGGDVDRGRHLFSGKAVCSQCHRIGRQGANIGPDLTQIGGIRTRRDLLEAIVAPSATLARGYESVTVVASGKQISGIVRSETHNALQLLTADRSETVVPRDEIDEIVPSRLSIMPQGLDRNLTDEELRDLLAFLASLGRQSAMNDPSVRP
jgi:putative heme-binding domain-containing protein